MVQNLVEPLNEDVIKVTIKDKPGPRKVHPEERLRTAFDVLKLYAIAERRVRQLRSLVEERGSRRRLRRCFEAWRRESAAKTAAKRQPPIKPTRLPGEVRIELLVSAIAAEKQRREAEAERKPPPAPRKPGSAKVAPPVRTAEGSEKTAGAPGAEKLDSSQRAKRAQEQRARLAEERRQQQEAKLRELDRAAQQTSKKTIEVARQALGQCDQRTRRGIIHLMRERAGCRDQSLIEIPRVPSPPGFLMRMEARSEARKERMKQADEIRRRRREEQKKRDESSRLRAEEEQRQQQIQAQKEAVKIRREQELKRLKEIERTRRLEQLADQCYNRYLFRRYILEPLSGIVEEKHQVFKVARKHYEETLLSKVFRAWKNEWTEQLKTKLQLADKFHRHSVLWYSFDEWRALAVSAKQKHQVAVDFYDMSLQKKCFKRWNLLCVRIRVIVHEQEVKAKKHREKRLKKMCFDIWRRYVTIASEVNESEQRRDEWRELIRKFIPETPIMKKRAFDF